MDWLWCSMKLFLCKSRLALLGLMLCIALSTTACTALVLETAKKLREDRQTDDQITDTQIGVNFLSVLSDRDNKLLLDVNADVWELRVMLTGTVSDPKTRQELIKLARADKRIKKIHDEIQIVSTAEQVRRQSTNRNPDAAPKEGLSRVVGDLWIEAKISAKLIAHADVTSVNYRWRSVRNITYLIGRAQSQSELKTVLAILNDTMGVSQVKSFVEVKPTPKS
jgi:osmotically-inducible protein OsmY